jgi:hypothetical protein
MRIVQEYRRPVLIAWRIAFWFLVFVVATHFAAACATMPGVRERGDWLDFAVSFGLVGLLFAGALAWLWGFLARKDCAWKSAEDALIRRGVETEAEIVDKEFVDLQELETYVVRYQFHKDFCVEARDGSLGHRLYNLEIGHKVRVRYLPENPEFSQLISPVPVRER